jgi:hypothetical protein
MPARNDELTRANREVLLARKMKQVEEGRSAMVEYQRDRQATLANMAVLRAQRLAREAAAISPQPKVTKPKTRKVVRVRPRGI